MWILDWFWGVLSSLGLYQKNAKILLLGLDDSGKTTLLGMLKYGRLVVSYPTQKPTMEELSMGSVHIRAYDMGGHLQARKIWKEYFPEVSAVVYLVDSCARERFAESKKELGQLLASNELNQVPFVVLGNKIDAPGAVSEDELREALCIPEQTHDALEESHIRPVELFMCSIVHKSGYKEAFNWLAQYL